MKKETPEDTARKLAETWTNGNRADVLRAISGMSGTRGAFTAGTIVLILKEGKSPCSAERFVDYLESRLK